MKDHDAFIWKVKLAIELLDPKDEEAMILHNVRKYLPSETPSVCKELVIGGHRRVTYKQVQGNMNDCNYYSGCTLASVPFWEFENMLYTIISLS